MRSPAACAEACWVLEGGSNCRPWAVRNREGHPGRDARRVRKERSCVAIQKWSVLLAPMRLFRHAVAERGVVWSHFARAVSVLATSMVSRKSGPREASSACKGIAEQRKMGVHGCGRGEGRREETETGRNGEVERTAIHFVVKSRVFPPSILLICGSRAPCLSRWRLWRKFPSSSTLYGSRKP